jgi:glycosyltransferase involved in cell wall biosynthesis
MRLLAIAYTYYVSDPRVMREAEAATRHGMEVEVLCLRRPGEPSKEVIEGVTIRRLPIQRYRGSNAVFYISSYLLFFLVAFFYTLFLYSKRRYQIIHVHTMPDFLIFAALVPRLLGARVILDMHDFMPETFGTKFGKGGFLWQMVVSIEKLSTSFADHIITVHEPYVELIKTRGIPQEKITAILNLPDHRIFYPRPFKYSEQFTVVYFGTIAERHGIDLFLRALALLKENQLPIQFLLIGEGDGLPKVKQVAEELRLGESFKLIDHFVNVWELPSYIEKCHLGVIPYRSDPATHYMLPVKLLEYVSMELPVVASRLETISVYFTDDMICFVPPEDIQAMADAIQSLYASEQSRRSLVKNARRFTQQYNWQKERLKLYSIYDRLTIAKDKGEE